MEDRMIKGFIENYTIFYKTKKLKSDKYSSELLFKTNLLYNIDYQIKGLFMIYGSRLLGTYKADIKILSSFLNDVLLKKIPLDQLAHSLVFNESSTVKHSKYKLFPYGVDEYFLNDNYIKYINEHNIKHSYLINYSITSPLFGIYKEKIK